MTIHVPQSELLQERAWQVREGIFEAVIKAVEQLEDVAKFAESGEDAQLQLHLNLAMSAIILAGENSVVLKKLAQQIGGANG